MDNIAKELVILAQNKDLPQIGSLVAIHQYFLLYKFFKQYVPKGSSVLDWGVGIGHFSYFLCRSGYKATGFSMEEFNFKNWLKGYPYKFVKGNTNEPTRLRFKDGYFDAVASVGVLEHVHEFGGNELASLNEIARILKPNGLFICYHLPNYHSWIEYLGKILTKKFHHQYRFTSSDIKQMLGITGLKLLYSGRYGFLPRNSMGRLPKRLTYSKTLAWIWDSLDNILSFIFSPFCQNYFFVARKQI